MHIDSVDKLNIHMVYKNDEEFLRLDGESWFQDSTDGFMVLDDDVSIELEDEFQEYLKHWGKNI